MAHMQLGPLTEPPKTRHALTSLSNKKTVAPCSSRSLGSPVHQPGNRRAAFYFCTQPEHPPPPQAHWLGKGWPSTRCSCSPHCQLSHISKHTQLRTESPLTARKARRAHWTRWTHHTHMRITPSTHRAKRVSTPLHETCTRQQQQYLISLSRAAHRQRTVREAGPRTMSGTSAADLQRATKRNQICNEIVESERCAVLAPFSHWGPL